MYDRLARLVFGRAIADAPEALLRHLPRGQRVLVLGGGSGQLLKPLIEVAEPQELWFVDVSSAMLKKARAFWEAELAGASTEVHFLQGTQNDLPEGLEVEIIITPFLLDLFSPSELQSLFDILDAQLLPGGHWYLSDFRIPTGFFHLPARFLIWLMYRSFRLVTGISGRRLPDFSALFHAKTYGLLVEKRFFHQMIMSQLWQKRK